MAKNYGDMNVEFANAQLVTTNSFFLGTYIGLTEDKLDYIEQAVGAFFENIK